MAEIFSQLPRVVHHNETLTKLLANENTTSSSQVDLGTKQDLSPSYMKMESKEASKANTIEEHLESEPYDLSTHSNSGLNSPQDLDQEADNQAEILNYEHNQPDIVENQNVHNGSNTMPNYGNGMLANMNELRHKRLLCDVIIKVGTQNYYAHKAVLASCSQYFGEKLLSGFQNKETIDILEIDSVSSKGIELLLDFVYTGETLINESTLDDLKQAAELTQIEKLIGICNRYQKCKIIDDEDNNRNYNILIEDNHHVSISPQRKLSNEEPKDLRTSTKSSQENNIVNAECEPPKQRRISEPVLPRINNAILEKQRRSSLSYSRFDIGKNCQEPNDHTRDQDFKPILHKYNSNKTHPKKYQFYAKHNDLNQEQDVFKAEIKNIDGNSPLNLPKKDSLSFSADKLLGTNRTTSHHSNHVLADWEKQFSYGFANRFNFNQQLQDWIRPISTNPLIKPMFNASPTGIGWHENPWTNMFRSRLAQANFPHFNRELFPCYQNIFTPGSKRISLAQTYSPLTAQRKDRHMSSIREQPDSPPSFPRFTEAKKAKFDRSNSHPPTANSNKVNHKTFSQDNDISLNSENGRSSENNEIDKKQTTKKSDTCKPYKCPLCEANFNRPANLKTHMRIHSGEKPYKCDTCGARFVQVAHLRAHVLIHTGEKPYPCNICGTSFRHLQTLKSHLRIHTGEKPYSCEKCCVKFRHKSQLRLHLRTKHGIQTNTKKTYKQVPGLCSADICAHIKRAQEVAKCQNKATDVIGRGRSEKLTGNTRAFVNLMEVSTLSFSNGGLQSTETQYEQNSDEVTSPEPMHNESNYTRNANQHLSQTSNNHFSAIIPTA